MGRLTFDYKARTIKAKELRMRIRVAPFLVGVALSAAGYQGWYVLEQDTILPEPPPGEGPVAAVRQSLAYLRSLT